MNTDNPIADPAFSLPCLKFKLVFLLPHTGTGLDSESHGIGTVTYGPNLEKGTLVDSVGCS